jgi:hypothetical protein
MFHLLLISSDDPVIAELRVLDVYAFSPLAALNKLYELQQRVREQRISESANWCLFWRSFRVRLRFVD